MDKEELEKHNINEKDSYIPGNQLTKTQIQDYILERSKDLNAYYQGTIITDIFLKFLLLIAVIVYGVIENFGTSLFWIDTITGVLIIVSLVFQFKSLSGNKESAKEKDVKVDCVEEAEFFQKNFFKVSVLTSLSAPFLIIVGSAWYIFIKYDESRVLGSNDYLVFAVFSLVGFLFSLMMHLWQYRYRLKQLKDCLTYADDQGNGIDAQLIQKQQKSRQRFMIIMIGFVVIGIILLAFFVF